MLSIEEYITKRKRNDKLNEKDITSKSTNTKHFLTYVLDYFNDYLSGYDEKTVADENKLENYIKSLKGLSEKNKNFLCDINLNYSNYIDRHLKKFIEQNPQYFLISSDADYREFSYKCFPDLIKRFPYLVNYTNELFELLKDLPNAFSEDKIIYINDNFNEWINDTNTKYNVSLEKFGYAYANYFFNNDRLWESKCRDKDNECSYAWEKAKNIFNIKDLYLQASGKPFIKNRKKELEMLIAYYWFSRMMGTDEDLKKYISIYVTI
jgi:hypothetical protein